MICKASQWTGFYDGFQTFAGDKEMKHGREIYLKKQVNLSLLRCFGKKYYLY